MAGSRVITSTLLKELVPAAGVEPATFRSGGEKTNQNKAQLASVSPQFIEHFPAECDKVQRRP
jgi:hypothetical protein